MKSTLALAMARGSDPVIGPQVTMLRDLIAAQSTSGTSHYGGVAITVQTANGPVADQRVATPHLWQGLMLAMALLTVALRRAARARR
jgi:hypothetical protein